MIRWSQVSSHRGAPSCQSSLARQQRMQRMQMQTWTAEQDPPRPPFLHPQDAPTLQPPHKQVVRHLCTGAGRGDLAICRLHLPVHDPEPLCLVGGCARMHMLTGELLRAVRVLYRISGGSGKGRPETGHARRSLLQGQEACSSALTGTDRLPDLAFWRA